MPTLLLFLAACPLAPPDEPPPAEPYADVLARVEARRDALASLWEEEPGPELLDEARRAALSSIRDDLLPGVLSALQLPERPVRGVRQLMEERPDVVGAERDLPGGDRAGSRIGPNDSAPSSRR